MEAALQESSIRGDVTLMHQVLHQDPLALERIQISGINHTPLHIAAFRGHLPLVVELINRCPGLVLVLDHRRWSPLHLAAIQGHREIVRVLAQVGSEMCGVLDGDGYNAVHLAVVKGQVEVLTELIRVGLSAVRAKTAAGDGVLHICVKFGRLDCFKILVENVKDLEFANATDGDGNNVLHQAVKYKQIQIINYIIIAHKMKIDMNAGNAMKMTPLDILLEQSHHLNVMDFEIRDILVKSGARRSSEILSAMAIDDAYASDFQITSRVNRVMDTGNHNDSQNNIFGSTDWLPRRRESLMVVASLIASMAFAAGLNPPGGVWQENSKGVNGDLKEIPHRAGEAIIAYNYPDSYKFYLRSNTIAYVASLSIILLLISGLPFRRRRYMWTLQVIMWVTITAMAFTYSYSLVALTPKKDRGSLIRTLVVAVLVWGVVMALVFIGNGLRLFMKWAMKEKNCLRGSQ